jgi:hypothetical protein
MIVYVLIVIEEEHEWATECLGVFLDYDKAEQAKFAAIRERFDIPLDEVSDADLNDEVYDMGNGNVTYEIFERLVIE